MYISMKVLSEQVDIHQEETTARAAWDKGRKSRRTFEEWTIRLLPIGLVIMAAAFYLLSAPHTAHLLNLITPGWGFVAPIGWELGIVIIAALRAAGRRGALTFSLIGCLILLSMFINVIGGFMAVVALGSGQQDVSSKTMQELMGSFSSLPAAFQGSLLLVIPVGLSIPFMASLVGEILVRIALGQVSFRRESDEEVWARESARVMKGALIQAALKLGAGTATAGNWAESVVGQMYQYQEPLPARQRALRVQSRGQALRAESASNYLQPSMRMGFLGQSGQSDVSARNPIVPDLGAALPSKDTGDEGDSDSPRIRKADVIDWLKAQPSMTHLTDRAVCRLYMKDRFGVESELGYKTIQRARKEL